MNRLAWLREQRRLAEQHEDTIYAPIYDQNWGEIDPLHERFFGRFLGLCPTGGLILDAACGTGKYWPMILDSGRSVFGIDQSQGMLAQAKEKFPDVPVEKVGLQEMGYQDAFDGAVCMDAMEMIPPEDWLLVLGNFHRAIKPQSYWYFTVEITTEEEIERAFADAQHAGLPVVYGEWAYEGGYHWDWAQAGAYHYYPKLEKVREWLRASHFRLIDEAEADEYHHFLVQKLNPAFSTRMYSHMTGRIELRAVLNEDLPIFFEQQLDPAANHMAAFTVKDPADRDAFLARWARILGDKTTVNRTILFDGRVAGHVASFEQFGEREVTYWLGKEYWGKGIATRALAALLTEVEVRPLFARAAKDNFASIRVLEKCGFTIIGEGKGFANARGEEVEDFILRLEAEAR